MKPWAGLTVTLLLGAILAFLSVAGPRPGRIDDSPAVFSSARAMADIRVIAAEPHPVGSPANAKVRDYLVGRMRSLGLEPRVQRAVVRGVAVENLIGVLRGADRGAPALALMAHYDSAPGSPGAGDDASGVAAILEIVRALKVRGVPVRDVAVLITDGEEANLLGARALFAADPIAARIGLVINLETRGGGGRAVMFETNPGNGALVSALQGAAVAPVATSVTNFVYQRMPNSTDLGVAIGAGKLGYNFAFIDRQVDYHTATATVDRLELGAVQSMGRQALKLTQHLAFAPALPARAPDKVYSHTFGDLIIAYPPAFGWVVWAAALGLLAGAVWRARAHLKWTHVVLGAALSPLMLIGPGLVLWAARMGTGHGFGFRAQQPLLQQFGLWETAIVLICAASLALAARLVGRRSGSPGVWLGLLIIGAAGAGVVQQLAPLVAYLLTWPLLLAAAGAAAGLGGERRFAPTAFLVALAAVSVGWITAIGHYIAIGLDEPWLLSAFVWLSASALWPLLAPVGDDRKIGWAAALIPAVAAAVIVAILR